MDLLESFFKFLKTHHLVSDQDSPTLLAVSGGLDSMVMMHLFYRAGLPFAVAHCNFQLRGVESDGDEHFVEKVALGFDVPFFVSRFETKVYAAERGISTQMAARNLRYEWFAQLAAEHNFSGIATAHHLNDSVETVLLNLARGTGMPGLSGIAPKTGRLIRPLLFASRNEILEYSRIHEITWREDSSNDLDDYARNFVRHHIIPRLEDLNPSFLNTATRNMARIGEAENNLNFLLGRWLDIDSLTWSETINININIPTAKLSQLPSPSQALRTLLKPYGFDAEQARQLAENLEHIGLELHNEKGFKALVDRGNILITSSKRSSEVGLNPDQVEKIRIEADDLMVSLPDGTRIFQMPVSSPDPGAFSIDDLEKDPNSTVLDAERLKFPLHLRHWMPGDSFQPLGMGGKSQKLQDFFTNQKLSRFEKDKVWLLCNGDEAIIWVLGLRLDERFKIHSHTNKVLKINWIK